MTMLRATGTFLVVMGIVWALQGLGWLNWPRGSFMLSERQWAIYGTLTAMAGVGLLVIARRAGRPRE
ncbi:hypothetical protein [Porphyrobacter sp. YT40]|uniref:hypothetical protein n=1 Tax=Porphyrobacter sp. YT40 TaxID=2547601 RepID=UPI00114360F3|nr:hypothetical protein [Porphyrobacter sp. YT40]QDH34804.1 hypothetical protein E2E27_11000 [Porphyrobacter sp. YT40]